MATDFLKWSDGCCIDHLGLEEELQLVECRECETTLCYVCKIKMDNECFICAKCAKHIIIDRYFETICDHYLRKLKYVGFQSFWAWMYQEHVSLEAVLDRNKFELVNQYLEEVHSIFVKIDDLLPRGWTKEDNPLAKVGKIQWA